MMLLVLLALAAAPIVSGVDVTSPHRLPEPRPEPLVAPLVGRPFSRERVRVSLDRLWGLSVFERVEIEAVDEGGKIRLLYRVSRRPHLEDLEWTGDLGLDAPDLAATAALALGGPADPERLERARREVLARLTREGYLGAAVQVTVRANPVTNGRAVTFVVAAGEQARVGRVTLTGLSRAEEAPLRKALGLDEGDDFRERALRDGVRALEEALHERGFFESRVIAREPVWDRASNRADVTVQISEGPLTRVVFSGLDALAEKALRERLTFADSRLVDEVEVRASAGQIERAYREAGHHFVQVTGALGGDAGGPLVTFEIDEGPRVQVESVAFEGVSTVPASRLRDQMRTRPSALTVPGVRRGVYVEEALAQDVRALHRFLQTQGFPRAEVGPPRTTFSEDRRHARIVIPVLEGPRQTVGAVTISGNRVIPEEPIRKALGLRPGDPWDAEGLDDARRKVEQLYHRRGYHAAAAKVSAIETDGRVAVAVDVTEGDLTRAGRVLISGLTATKRYVLERELQFGPGDPLDAVDLHETRRRLDATRLFDRVDVEVKGTPGTPFRDVEIAVREAKPWRFEFGVGYDTEEGFRGFVTLGNDNLFGTGRSVSLTARMSEKSERTEAKYRQPWLFGTPWRGEAVAFRERKDEIGFVTERFGGTFTAQRDLLSRLFRPDEPTDHPRSLRGGVRYRLEQFRREDIDPELLAEETTTRDERVSSLMPFLTLELRDNPTDPRTGSYHFIALEVGSSGLGGEIDFVKFTLEDSWFVAWPPPTVLAFSTRLGLAAPFGDSADLVIEDRFKAGGSTTIRGYRLDRVGPVDSADNPLGGDLRILLNVEWRFPIWRFLGGVTFLDAGTVLPRVRDFTFSEIFPGAGAGLRIATPIGPIRLDVGYALRPLRNEDRVQFYLSVGHAF